MFNEKGKEVVIIVRKITKYGTYVIMAIILAQLSDIAMWLVRYNSQPMPGFSQYVVRLFEGAARVQRGNQLEIPYEWLSIQILYMMGLCGMVSSDLGDNAGLMKICQRDRLYWWNGKIRSLFFYSVSYFLVLYGLIGLFVLFLGGKGIAYSNIWIQEYGNHSIFRYTLFCQIVMECMICLVMGLLQLVLEIYTRSPFSVFVSLSLILLSIFPDACRYSFFKLTMFRWNYARLWGIRKSWRGLLGILLPACVAGVVALVLNYIGRKKGRKIEFY